MFHHHPDDIIYIINGSNRYVETLVNFKIDILEANLSSYPNIPDGFKERRYDGKTCIVFSQRGGATIESMAWNAGDLYLKNVELLQQVKKERGRPPILTFNEFKIQSIESVYDLCSEIRLKIAGTTDQVKIASWANYKIMADKYKNGISSADELLAIDAEISLRNLGETRDSFVDKIISNSSRYSMANGIIMGAERLAFDTIKKATNENQVKEALSLLDKTLKNMLNT